MGNQSTSPRPIRDPVRRNPSGSVDRTSTCSMLGRDLVRSMRRRVTVLPFHAAWIEAAYAPGIEIAALSLPRGGAKTWLAANLTAENLTPGTPTFEAGVETCVVSASMEQSRILMTFLREALADRLSEYRWNDSPTRQGAVHKATNARVRVLSSSGKRALGLSQFSTIIAEEPSAWQAREGALMWDSLRTSLGKRDGQRVLLIGTRAPAPAGNWWPELLDSGSAPGIHVTDLHAPAGEPWDEWRVIRACNPMLNVNESLRRTVLRERDEARRNETLRPVFEAYRLNRAAAVGREVLLTIAEWDRVAARPVPPRDGQPIAAVDLGGERSWSACWLQWPNGRSECFAVCPGIPDLSERERQDGQPPGMYTSLADAGVLIPDEGRRMARVSVLVDRLDAMDVHPMRMMSDRFIVGELLDVVAGRWPVEPRRVRWSESTEDIAAFRRIARDGPPTLAVADECRPLVEFALSEAECRPDDGGSCRLVKHRNNRSRDDIAVSGTLAAGAIFRLLTRPQPKTFFEHYSMEAA